MVSIYVVHLVWFLLSVGFGVWMYSRGAIRGAHTGINAAVFFLTTTGNTAQAKDFALFINDLQKSKSDK